MKTVELTQEELTILKRGLRDDTHDQLSRLTIVASYEDPLSLLKKAQALVTTLTRWVELSK